jgi:hypothetical protein
MERAEARRLPPHYIESFFLEAFQRLGGSVKQREPRRYEVTHAPAPVRNRDRLIGIGEPVLPRYERIVFEKSVIAAFVCPGHPLLDAVIDLTLERHRDLLRLGAVLVDERDPGAIAEFRQRRARRAQNERILTWPDAQTLADAELAIDGRPTFAALVLFGTRAALGRHLAQAEVVSPGGFPPGVTPENILEEQNPRNRRLSEALGRCGLVERAGQGMNLENLASFATQDFLVLDLVHRKQPVPDALRLRLLRLREQGLIESVGRGRGVRYLLSRRFHAVLGQRGVYTRRRGLDHDTNRELLARHLSENAQEGCPVAQLQQVIPHLSRRGVQRLLDDLRAAGRARLVGVGRGSRWFPTDKRATTGSNPPS